MNSTFTKILRVLLGAGLIVFGVNKFFEFLPIPEFKDNAASFMSSLDATGYVLPVLGGLEIAIGLLLISNKWTPFALLLLAPISVNIILFHLFLDLPDILSAVIVFGLNVVLIYKHWKVYRVLFQ